jgi:cob(I)alamin adenosyltransferase
MKIYTRTGDDGTTGLFGGPRVSKDHDRIEAYGTVDELNACLGVVRSLGVDADLDQQLEAIQHGLFAAGAELASPDPVAMGTRLLKQAHVEQLERWIDQLETELAPLSQFILPAGTPAAAYLHLARGICRRAERRVVTLEHRHHAEISQDLLQYLNRISDLLFVQSRVVNSRAKVGDLPWIRGS